MARRNVYVGDETHERMSAFPDVNWSQVAAVAFREHLRKMESDDGQKIAEDELRLKVIMDQIECLKEKVNDAVASRKESIHG